MYDKINILDNKIPKISCSNCTHLSLKKDLSKNFYNIKCILFDEIKSEGEVCKYFESQYSPLSIDNVDDNYIDFLNSCIDIKYDDYLKSIHWQLFKKKALEENEYKCSICKTNKELDVYHLNKNLGHETYNDVIVSCKNCIKL